MNLDYIAGFFDGEGSITFTSKPKLCPRFSIAQSRDRGQRVLLEVKEFLLSFGIASRVHASHMSVNAKIWQLQSTGRKDVIIFLTLMMPRIRVKKSEAQDMLRFLKLYPDLRTAPRWYVDRGRYSK